jgi:hypothetical protein
MQRGHTPALIDRIKQKDIHDIRTIPYNSISRPKEKQKEREGKRQHSKKRGRKQKKLIKESETALLSKPLPPNHLLRSFLQ